MTPEQSRELRTNLRYVIENLPRNVLLHTAEELLADLVKRIDAAPSHAKPVYAGIAALHESVRIALRPEQPHGEKA